MAKLVEDVPMSTKNSPMKIHVTGSPKEATEKRKNNATNLGMDLCKPPQLGVARLDVRS